MFIDHPVLHPDTIQFRGYQVNLARVAGEHDTLVVLPTGMGKTIVALLALADALRDGAKHILLLAPTKPLVEQHARFFADVLQKPWSEQVACLTGSIAPDKRGAAYARPGIVVATPQVVANDLIGGRLRIDAWDWIVFDEAHRATGDYPYTFIGQEAQKHNRRGHRLGLTASPGHDVRRIQEVRDHLGLGHVEIRTPTDTDVRDYVQDVGIEWETLPMPATMARVSQKLHDALAERVRSLKQVGILEGVKKRPTRMQLLEVGKKLQVQIKQRADPPPELYQAMSVQAQTMKILHAIELAETQGGAPFVDFIARMRKEADGPGASKASRMLAADKDVNEAFQVARHDTIENPKLGRLQVLVQEQLDKDADARIIVFAHYRDTCLQVENVLRDLEGVRPVVFVGQGKRGGKEGLTQKQQAEIVEAFRAGTHNVLIATSVAEEGLDIPQTDLVLFYEPIPSEIRSIQRRGRTGRNREGRVVVLMTKGTQDEAAHWTARRKEQQMVRELQDLRRMLQHGAPAPTPSASLAHTAVKQSTLDRPAADIHGSSYEAAGPQNAASTAAKSTAQTVEAGTINKHDRATLPGTGPLIVCDHREQTGGVVRHLHTMGARIETRQLETGDFILSDRVVVERKACGDFVDSLLDGRLFEQVKGLQVYQKPLLVLEGDGLEGHRNVASEALQGALASITIDYGVPVMQTRDALETARFLVAVAKREQGRNNRKVAVRSAKTHMDDEERLFHILAGFPGISTVLARRLLAHFGDLRSVFAANVTALAAVEGIGPKTANEMHRILDRAHAITETV